MRRALLTAALTLAVVVPAHADHERPGEATKLVDRAQQVTIEQRPACRGGDAAHPDRPPVADGEASPALRELLAPYRRPATEEELRVAEDPGSIIREPFIQPVWRQGVRILHAESGTRFTLVNGLTAPLAPPARTLRRCQRADRRTLARLSRGRTAAVQRRARRALARVHRAQRPGPDGPVEGLLVAIQRPNDDSTTFAAAPFDPDRFRRRGVLVVSGRASGDADMQAVVPDGVATVTMRYPRRDAELTGTVRDNVVTIRIPDPPQWAISATYTWRGPDGAVVNQYAL